ncbi:restriction endonuclease [Brachybacterium alimentarium]|uniref:restriction endonuclease n=1 Tax=Brachybacterium alimentarium TaxID=47845 RepID=UPI003FD697B4
MPIRSRTNASAQLWALRGRIAVGDLFAMPVKTTREIAIGRVASPHTFLADNDPTFRHVVGGEWIRQVLRSALKQALPYALGSALTIFSHSRNNAAARLKDVLRLGEDAGSHLFQSSPASAPAPRPVGPVAPAVVDEPESQLDIDMIVRDQISSRIDEELSGHSFAHLVAELLRVEGFDTNETPPGADGGIDITIARGLLSLESQKLIVQVKTPQIGSDVVTQLNGLVHTHGADYGLLATWSGLT